jgi:cell division protein FtsB
MAAKARGGAKLPVKKVEGSRIVARVVLPAMALGIIAFAVQGGEYGTTDLVGQKRAIAREKARVDSLERSIARLQVERKAIEADPRTQERIAREEFGMVKGDRELLYRFTDSLPDSTRR